MTTTTDFNAAAPPPPTSCPFCRSAQVATTSKTISTATYWRCVTCGQIWNPARLLAQRPKFNRW